MKNKIKFRILALITITIFTTQATAFFGPTLEDIDLEDIAGDILNPDKKTQLDEPLIWGGSAYITALGSAVALDAGLIATLPITATITFATMSSLATGKIFSTTNSMKNAYEKLDQNLVLNIIEAGF